MDNTGHIFFIMGPSGSGKGTLIKNIKTQKIDNLHLPLSYKTREKRDSEIHGIDAYFITHDEFDNGIDQNEFLEYAILYGGEQKYGTKYSDVLDHGVYKGKVVIKEIDILGLKRLKKEKPELREHYTTIFLMLDPSIIQERLLSRGDMIDQDEENRRIETAVEENNQAKIECDHIINALQQPEEVLEQAKKIIFG